jgi:endoribonuclease Dicer
VKELNAKLFDHVIPERLLHMSISAPSAGIEYDYERLELFGEYYMMLIYPHHPVNGFSGDAFLKYLSSIYVFVTNPTQNESSLHIIRQRIINNKALMQHAFRSHLPEFIQAKPFVLRSWQPPNFVVAPSSPKGSNLDASGGCSAIIHTQSSNENECNAGPLDDSKSFPTLQAVPITQESLETAENLRLNKRTRKQKQQDERNVQWLGDKVLSPWCTSD